MDRNKRVSSASVHSHPRLVLSIIVQKHATAQAFRVGAKRACHLHRHSVTVQDWISRLGVCCNRHKQEMQQHRSLFCPLGRCHRGVSAVA